MPVTCRIVSWNVAYRRGPTASRQGAFLAKLDPDLVLLQEVNPGSSASLVAESGLDWLVRAVDVRAAQPDDRPVRRRGVAIGGRGMAPEMVSLLSETVRLPERMLTASVVLDGRWVTAISYHAPPGVTWGMDKVRHSQVCEAWLRRQHGPVVMGADANTPELDMPDFSLTRTHWHTGMRKLAGERGDDVLFGPDAHHDLTDALRSWLENHPEEMERTRLEHPEGPLALSHRTGRRKTSPGVDRRFDAIWLSPAFHVEQIAYPYDASLEAGSDHSAVVADVTLRHQ